MRPHLYFFSLENRLLSLFPADSAAHELDGRAGKAAAAQRAEEREEAERKRKAAADSILAVAVVKAGAPRSARYRTGPAQFCLVCSLSIVHASPFGCMDGQLPTRLRALAVIIRCAGKGKAAAAAASRTAIERGRRGRLGGGGGAAAATPAAEAPDFDFSKDRDEDEDEDEQESDHSSEEEEDCFDPVTGDFIPRAQRKKVRSEPIRHIPIKRLLSPCELSIPQLDAHKRLRY